MPTSRHDDCDERPQQRRGAFFGRRKGHPLRPRQAALFDTLLPRLALDLRTPAPADLRALFPTPVDDVRLEIGFGGGEHLIARGRAASAHRLHRRRAVRQRHGQGAGRDRGAQARQHPAASRRRHRPAAPGCRPARSRASICSIPIRGRSGGTGSGASCRTRASRRSRASLRPGGEFRFATDIADYAAWTLQRGCCARRDFDWTAERADDWRLPWPGFTGTRYEAKAKREGRAPCYLIFRRGDRVSLRRR